MPYLVDSDVLIDASRGNVGAASYLNSLDEWSVSVVTAMELVAGAQNKQEVADIEIMLSVS